MYNEQRVKQIRNLILVGLIFLFVISGVFFLYKKNKLHLINFNLFKTYFNKDENKEQPVDTDFTLASRPQVEFKFYRTLSAPHTPPTLKQPPIMMSQDSKLKIKKEQIRQVKTTTLTMKGRKFKSLNSKNERASKKIDHLLAQQLDNNNKNLAIPHKKVFNSAKALENELAAEVNRQFPAQRNLS